MTPIASKELKRERLAVCDKCSCLDVKTDKCKECGCYVAYKVLLRKSKCPLNKW